jgi:hypothetical protein
MVRSASQVRSEAQSALIHAPGASLLLRTAGRARIPIRAEAADANRFRAWTTAPGLANSAVCGQFRDDPESRSAVVARSRIGELAMNSHQNSGAHMRMRARRWKWVPGLLLSITVMMVTDVRADAFGPVRYDAGKNQIIVTMIYDGTNPNHHFSIRWGRCHRLHDQLQGPARKIINVGILDDEGNDAAMKRYTKIVRVSLAALSCRPAIVTL